MLFRVMYNKEIVAKRIKELRKSRKFSQEYLAEKLGIEPRQLSKLETGRHYPSFETMCKLLKVLNISFEDFNNYGHFNSNLREIIHEKIDEMNNDKLVLTYKFIIILNN